ncbi:MAG: undecaprenyl diphosphate synthase family protein, partial [Alkalibacterium sp.]
EIDFETSIKDRVKLLEGTSIEEIEKLADELPLMAGSEETINALKEKDADLLVLGNTDSKVFPKELLPYANKRTKFGEGKMKVNFLVNYGWNWDLNYALKENADDSSTDITKMMASKDVSRMDMILRWGGRRRLSGFLPVQSIYSDIYVFDELWPDYKEDHLHEALAWYQETDVTLGG